MARRAGGGKYCVEGCRFVDALDLCRKGYLQPPAPGKPPYAVTANCGGREQYIATAWTPCRFGGKRLWFQCGYCARRVLRLYIVGGVFACRHCHRLGYESRLETSGDLVGFRKSAGGWAAALMTRSGSFPPSRGVCTGGPTNGGAAPMTTPRNGRSRA